MFFNEKKQSELRTVPLLPLRDIIVFPYMVVPLFVGRPKSIAALDHAMATDKLIMLQGRQTMTDKLIML